MASDPLYYGECNFDFTPGFKQNLKIDLRPAHIKLKLTVKGLDRADKLSVNLSNTLSSYNFLGEPVQNSYVSLKQTLNYVDQVKGFVANMNIFKPKTIKDDMEIKVESSLLPNSVQFNLMDFIKKNYPSIDITDLYKEIMLDMLIQFDGVDVSVSILNWEDLNTGGVVS